MKKFIQYIYEGKLSDDELRDSFEGVVSKEYSAEQIVEVILYIKSKQRLVVNLPTSIDVCGTGGSGLDRLNTSTLTAIKLSKQGISVAKHGNKASSGKFGSFDLLKQLNYKIPENKGDIIREYEKNNLVFLYANLLYPFLKTLSILRKEHGKPTIFNILGPLLSPVNSNIHLTGCSFENKMQLMVEVFKIMGKEKVLIVRGNDGLDEVTISDNTNVFELSNGVIRNYEISPESFGFNRVKLNEILVVDEYTKVNLSKGIIEGTEKSPYSDLVDLNVEVVKRLLDKH